jgi:hypothetical protein
MYKYNTEQAEQNNYLKDIEVLYEIYWARWASD